LHWGEPQLTFLKLVDLTGEKGFDVEQPTQPEQGIQAASLLVSKAKSKVWGGVPNLALTMYVGLCMICLADAIGTTDFLATKLDKYCILAWSLACSCRTFSSHDIGFDGLNGEHWLKIWNTLSVEPSSWMSHFGVCPWTREMKRQRRKGVRKIGIFMVELR